MTSLDILRRLAAEPTPGSPAGAMVLAERIREALASAGRPGGKAQERLHAALCQRIRSLLQKGGGRLVPMAEESDDQ